MIDYILDLLGYNSNRITEVLNFRFIVLILFIISVIFIVISLTKSYNVCPQQEIKYRYIPRSFKEEQDEPVPINSIFSSMFSQASPWINSFTKQTDVKKLRDSNYVSQ